MTTTRGLVGETLGLWLIFAGVVLPHASGDGRIEDIIGGICVVMFVVWSLNAFRPRIRVLATFALALAGLQIATAPWALGYAGSRLSVWDELVTGLIVVVLAARSYRDELVRTPSQRLV